MPGKYVLDTNIAAAVLNGETGAVARWIAADELLMPVVVLGELLFGVRASSRAEENERKLWQLVAPLKIVDLDRLVAGHYADLKCTLRRLGRPIPENDVWIAAVCRLTGHTLASRDRHFDAVPDLVRDEWS